MRILKRYILGDYLVIFLGTLLLITFVMTVGALVQAIDLMARGLDAMLILKFFVQNVPYILSFSMPISTLFAALLLFGRLSMDNEISAMKSCGQSLWRLVSPLILLSILFTVFCVYINSEVGPRAKHANRQLLRSVGVEEPVKLLEEGRFIRDFPGLMIYVGKKRGTHLKDIVAYELGDAGEARRSVRAKEGVLEADNEARILMVKLYDVRIEVPDNEDPLDISKTTYINAEYYPIKLDFNKMLAGKVLKKKRGDMTIGELLVNARNVETDYPHRARKEHRQQKMRYVIEANQRLSIALGCFTFMLVGIPLGIKSHRKETSAGMLISLGIVFVYYLFIVIAQALAKYPELYPNLIVWIPIISGQLLGFWLIRRSS